MTKIIGNATYVGADRAAVVVIGAFDGVHKGHQSLVSAARRDANDRQLPLIAFTFDPDPSELFLKAKAEKRLLAPYDRARALVKAGADACVILDFDYKLAATTPEAFVQETLKTYSSPVSVHVGTNFHFGAQGAGSTKTLADIGLREGFELNAEPLLVEHNQVVSATRIRSLIHAGDVKTAMELLGRRHFVRGHVSHGRGEGSSFGFATANVILNPYDCIPKEGVYGGYVVTEDASWPAAINVGTPRTFDGSINEAFAEAHLIGFEGNLYDEDLSLVFEAWIREPRTFSSVDELIKVVGENISWVQENITATFSEVRVDFA